MQELSQHGRAVVDDLSRRYGFSSDAVRHMLIAVINGNGSMAQFSHPEFGGSGQWMQGGMTMVGDMFNNQLQANVAGLCSELSSLIASQGNLFLPSSFQSQTQGGGQQQYQGGGGGASLFVNDTTNPRGNWWPGDLDAPSSTGAQNNVRYAYFPNARRLAIDLGGQVIVYDTMDHQIGGFGQQQSGSGSITFTSQYGTVDVSSLPVVSPSSPPAAQPAFDSNTASGPAQTADGQPGSSGEADVFAAIERLAGLRDKGILTDEEFSAKKAELLGRL